MAIPVYSINTKVYRDVRHLIFLYPKLQIPQSGSIVRLKILQHRLAHGTALHSIHAKLSVPLARVGPGGGRTAISSLKYACIHE